MQVYPEKLRRLARLGCDYGTGPAKLTETLVNLGVTVEQTTAAIDHYRSLYPQLETIMYPATEKQTELTSYYTTQVAVALPPMQGGKLPTLEAYDRCRTIWRPIYHGDDQQAAHRALLEKRDSPGFPVVRVVCVEREVETNRVVRKVTETIQQRLEAPAPKVKRSRRR